jgi:hypothetical protein
MFYLHHIFRSFLPLQNPIGFGAVDFFEFFIAAGFVLAASAWPKLKPALVRFAENQAACMIALFLAPIALRLALLHTHPIPTPAVADDFSYVLLGDTLKHFRLSNPPHPMSRFFETFFVLQGPTYGSIYPLGQGLVLALFGHPWAGVAISIGLFCSLCYWMLRAWTTPRWALLGGMLAVIQFGPLNQWMNSYWGGAVFAIAGCLVFGALGRRNAPIVGAGLALAILTRPFESILLALCAAALAPKRARFFAIAGLALVPALALTLLHNKAVTNHWATLPYQLSRDQYGVPASFTFQPNPIPQRELTREQRLDYEIQSATHDSEPSFLKRWLFRLRFYRFYFLAPLYLAIPFAFRRNLWIFASFAIFSVGTAFYPYFYAHYIAALACVFVLVAIKGLEQIKSPWIVYACFAQFAIWYGAHLIGDPNMWRFETWDAINYGDPDGRIAVHHQLAAASGKQLVFVRYDSRHTFKEWVYNEADIDRSRVVWARDLGADENAKLIHYYPDRSPWLLEPDREPPQLKPYFIPPPAPVKSETLPPPPKRPSLKFEEVH